LLTLLLLRFVWRQLVWLVRGLSGRGWHRGAQPSPAMGAAD
jgi:hypothetical protein